MALLTITYHISSQIFSKHFSIAYSPCIWIYMSKTLSRSRDSLMSRVQRSTQVSNGERGEEDRVREERRREQPLVCIPAWKQGSCSEMPEWRTGPVVTPNASQPATPNRSHPRPYTMNTPPPPSSLIYPSPSAPNSAPSSSCCCSCRLLRLSKPPLV